MKASAATRRERDVRARPAKPAPPPFRRKLLFEALEPRILLSAAPGTEALLLIPGFGATEAATPALVDEWLTTRGIAPDKLQIDPLSNSAGDLIASLENIGYSTDPDDWGLEDETPLIIANWDWRVRVAERDVGAADGTLTGVTAESITGRGTSAEWVTNGFQFETGLDYLGYYLSQAAEAGFESVDIITHSTGGLVARAYMQSAAYGAQYDSDGDGLIGGLDKFLPTVDDLVLVGVPSEGVSQSWNMLLDDYNVKSASRGMAHIMDLAWKKMEEGIAISGPDGDITLADLHDDPSTPQNEAYIEFAQRYIGAGHDLVGTYAMVDYADGVDGNFVVVAPGDPDGLANTLVADLNFGDGPENMVNRGGEDADGKTVIVYSDTHDTLGRLIEREGFTAEAGRQNELLSLGQVIGHLPASGQVWYEEADIDAVAGRGGDGTVTTLSARGPFDDFVSDRVVIKEVTEALATEKVDHVGLLVNKYSQKQILNAVTSGGVTDAQISQGEYYSSMAQQLSVIVGMGLIDVREFVLDALADISRLLDDLITAPALNVTIPFLDKSAIEVLSFAVAFRNAVNTARDAVDENMSLEELNEVLAEHLGEGFQIGFDNGQLTIDLDYSATADTTVDVAIPGGLIESDLSLDFAVTFNLDISVGIDLTTPDAGKDMVFLRFDELSLTTSVAEDDLDIEVDLGPVGTVAIVDGSASLEARLDIGFVDPNHDNKITLSELLNGLKHPTTFIDPTLSGTLDVVLPFDATVAGFDFGDYGTPTVEVHDDDIFDAEAPEVSGNIYLDDADVQANILALLADPLGGLEFLDTPLPLIGTSLNDIIGFGVDDVLDLDGMAAAYFASYETGGINAGGRANAIDLVDWVGDAVTERLESILNGGGDGPLTVSGGFDLATKTLFFNLDLNTAYEHDETLAFDIEDLGLDDLLDGVPLSEVIDLRGSAEIHFAATADLHLGFDLDFSEFADEGVQFSFDADTGFSASVTGDANDLDFQLGILGFGIVIADGEAHLALSAHANLGNEDGDENGDGRVQFGEIGDSLDTGVDGSARVELPLYFPIKALPVGGTTDDEDGDGHGDNALFAEAAFSLTPQSGLLTEFAPPTLPDFVFDFDAAALLIGLLNDPEAVLAGLEGFFEGIDTVADGIDFIELPLIGGSAFDDLAASLRGLRADVLGESSGGVYTSGLGEWLQDKAADPDDPGVFEALLDMVRQELYEGLSPLNGQMFSFVVPVLDDEGEPVLDPVTGKMKVRLPTSADDIELGISDSGDELTFNIKFAGVLVGSRDAGGTLHAAELPIDFEAGIPGISLEVEAKLQTIIDYALGLGIGINGDGIFVDTSGINEAGEEAAIYVAANIAEGSTAEGELGFLKMDFVVEEDSGINGHFGLDIADEDDDGRWFFGGGEELQFSLNAEASAHAMIGATVQTMAGGILPSVSTTIEYNQLLGEIHFTPGEGVRFDSGSPDVYLHDLTLNVGSVFGSFLGDALETINDIVQPFKPVVDILLTEVDLGITKFKMIDIARLKLPGKTVDTAEKVLEVIQSTIEFLDELEGMTTAGGINFGTFHLTESTIENPDAPSSEEDVAGTAPDYRNLNEDQVKALKGPDQKGLDTRKHTAGQPGKRPLPSEKRFSIPILEDPGSLLDFVLDRGAVDLFYYDLPDLDLLFEYQKTYPVFPGLNAGFFGSIGASTNFDFGYDTRGLREWWNADFAADKFWMIFDGFYLDDHGQENTDSDQPEVVLKAAVGAVASLGIGGLIEAGVKGGIEALIEFDLNDRLTEFQGDLPVGDGKFYGSELISRLSHGPECLFDMHGQLSVFLEAFFWIGLDLGFSEITIFEASERFVDQIIASFDHECLLDAPHDLAVLDSDGTLTLRYAGADSDGPHDYTVTHEASEGLSRKFLADSGYIDLDYYTQAELDDLGQQIDDLKGAGGQVIIVTTGVRAELFRASQVHKLQAFGTSEGDHYDLEGLNGLINEIDIRSGGGGDIIEVDYNPLGGILHTLHLDGGDGNDYIRVDPALLGEEEGVSTEYALYGGAGDDRIKLTTGGQDDPFEPGATEYGYSDVLLDGGEGNDTIFGNTGVEHIEGGAGDDVILSDAGADLVHGGGGNDILFGGDGDDQLFGDGGNDRLFGAEGGDELRGGDGDDTLMGEAGVDTLFGDSGNDLLNGAVGNDILFGGDGDDRATWELGDGVDTYSGGAGADELQMDGFVTDAQAFYTDPDNYIQDDGAVDTIRVRVGASLDGNGAHQGLVEWTHGAGPMLTLSTGEVETLRLDAGRGADAFHIDDVQSTSLDSVRLSGGQTRGIIEEAHIGRDAQGNAAGQDLALQGEAGDQFRLRIGNYGAASALVTLVDDGDGHVDFQSTAIAIQDALRSLLGNQIVDVTYDSELQKYKVSNLGNVADALTAQDAAVVATVKNIQELTLVATPGTEADPRFIQVRIGASGAVSEPIEVFPNPSGTAQSLETALRHLTGNSSSLEVMYGQNTYRVTGLGDSLLQLVSPPSGTTLSTAFSQQLVVRGDAGQTFKLSSGGQQTQLITIGASGAATASAVQSALRALPGFGALQVSFEPGHDDVAGETVLDSYRISGFAAFTPALTQVVTQTDAVSSTASSVQRLALTGTAGEQFRLQFGDAGLPSEILTLVTDANGSLDTLATAALIQEAVREMTGSTVATASFDETSHRYVIEGLSASAAALKVNTAGLVSHVAGSATATRVVTLGGDEGQQFRLGFGPGGKQTSAIAIGANGTATAAAMQSSLRALLGGTSVTVAFDADALAYNIDGLFAPADAMVLDPSSPMGGATFTSAPGVDIFKVFRIGPDESVDTVVIEGSSGDDDYRVSTIQAIGVDGKSETSLRYEQLNGQFATTGQALSYVVVDVFGLERHDYVRLDTFGGDDHIDATGVEDAVVSDLYLDGGAGDDRIIGSNLKDTSDVIVGGAGNDRLTGGAGVDQFFETVFGDASNTEGDFDVLIETRDADFVLSDTSLDIDDTVLHNQFGDEQEYFGDIFEAVELYGLDGANTFELSGWSDSGLLDGYKGGDTYILELASEVVSHQAIFINDTGASGIDTLTFKGSEAADFIQLDTVYLPAQDPDHRFTHARWEGYGNHGDGLIIAHFNPNAEGYARQDLDDEDGLMRVGESGLTAGDNFQVVNYHTVEQVVVFGGKGDDTFVSDSTAAQVDVYGNEGDDQFYIGSVLKTEEVLVEGQIVTVVKEITDGAVFNNSSYYGGDDDDYFEVNHNAADINLFGDNGNDTFLVKALLTINEDGDLVDLGSQVANVSGTFGAGSDQGSDVTNDTREIDVDSLVYVENANVNIDGGAGFDAVSLVGTVLSDTFYIYTEIDPATGKPVQRIYGAGVKLQKLLNIERLQVLAGGGDDTIYLYGTDMGPIGDLVIKAGSGSDTIFVGGAAQTITLSFPKNSDQFYSTVEGYQVDKDAVGKFIRVGEVDGMPFYQVRSLTRVTPFTVENPARTTEIVMPASYDLAAFKAPVLIDGGSGLHDEVRVNLTQGTQQVELSDRLLLRKEVKFDDAKLHLTALAADPLVQTLLAATGAAGTEARELLNGAVEDYIRFADRYDQPGLVQSLQALSGTQKLDVTVPAGISYFNIQNTLVDNEVVTAREQLIDFAQTFGLTLTWKDVAHPDPSRAAAGEFLHELLSIKKGGVSLAFEALHSETVVFNGSTRTIVKDLTAVTLKTTATLKATFDAGAITQNTLAREDAVSTLAPEGAKSRLHFSGVDTIGVQLSQLSGGSKLTIDNDLLTGRIEVQGGAAADQVFIKTVAAETVVHGGEGGDTITVGRNGTLDGIGAPLQLFGDGGADQVTIDDTADLAGRGVTLEKELLQHSTGFEQLSRITDALGLKNITAAENATIADRLEDAAVPYGRAAMDVDAADLTAYRDYAASGLLQDLKGTLTGLQTELATSVAAAVQTLKDTDQALLENQLELYVRARFYEGTDGKFLTDDLLNRMSAAGLNTWLKYRDWDPHWSWSSFSTRWEIDWGDSLAVPQDWSIKGGLEEIKLFFQNPDARFDHYGLAGVDDDWRSQQYLNDIQNLLTGRSLFSLAQGAYYNTTNVPDVGVKKYLLGGGALDGDEYMWLYLNASGVSGTKASNVFSLAKIYDEAVKDYVGSSFIYKDLLKQRGLTDGDLNTLYEQLKGDSRIRGFEYTETNYNKTKMIGSVGDFHVDIPLQYRKLSADVAAKVAKLEGNFKTTYQSKITEAQGLVQSAIDHADYSFATLNNIKTKTEQLSTFLDPRFAQSPDSGVTAEAGLAKAPVYNRLATGTGNGVTTLLGEVATLSQRIQDGDFAAVAAHAGDTDDFAALRTEFNTTEYHDVRLAYQQAADVIEDFTLFNARYRGDAPAPAGIADAVHDIKRADRAADAFGAFTATLQGTFSFDAFRTSFLATQNALADFVDQNPDYLPNILTEARAGAQAGSLAQDGKDIAQPVAVNRIQADLFGAALTKAKADYASLTTLLYNQYTVKRNLWWFQQTFHLDYTQDARYIEQKKLVDSLTQKYTLANNYAVAAELQRNQLNQKKAGYEATRDAAEAKVDARRAQYEALSDQIGGQFIVLKELSKFAIDVLRETREGQSAAGFVDTGSLISELKSFTDEYSVLPASAPAVPFDRSEFETGQSANSVITSEEHVRYAPILSVKGLGQAIHVGYDDVESLTVKLGNQADQVSVLDSLKDGSTTTILTGGGDDTISIGHDGSLDGIAGTVNIDAQGGEANRLTVDDSQDGDADFAIIDSDRISGMAAGNITYTASGGLFRSSFADGAFDDGIVIRAGRGNDFIQVFSSRAGGTVEVTGLYAGEGDDTVFVLDTNARYLEAHGQAGNDTIRAVGIAPPPPPPGIPGGPGVPPNPVAVQGLKAFGDDGDDTLLGGAGADVLVGGLGSDTISGGAANDVIVGDLAAVLRDNQYVVQRISTHEDEEGETDHLTSTQGNDVVIGGAGSDEIQALDGASIILGDAGTVVFADGSDQANDVFSTTPQSGAVDFITGGQGANIIIGGAGGDVITGGAGNEVIVGDGGYVVRDALGVVLSVSTLDDQSGDVDHIAGGAGSDVILGGAGGDFINASLGGDIILGDAGVVNVGGDVFTTNSTIGGDDHITGAIGAAASGSILIGGAGADELTGTDGDDIIVGDGGRVFRTNGVAYRVQSVDAGGGSDDITGGDGNDVILGGAAGDMITASLGGDIILGDSGDVDLLGEIRTFAPGGDVGGGNDTITGAGSGNAAGSILIGGVGDDLLTGTGGDDVIIGDGGRVDRSNGVLFSVETFDVLEVVVPGGGTVVITSGGSDIITGGDGRDVIMGGLGADTITASLGGDIILGDEGRANLFGAVETAFAAYGDDDLILGGDGTDLADRSILIGGAGADRLIGGTGDNIIIGDGGTVLRGGPGGSSVVTHVFTNAPGEGDNDFIRSGAGSDIILGGAGSDDIEANGGSDVILGDHGEVVLQGLNPGIRTTDHGIGAADTIKGGDGALSKSYIIGGAGADVITTGTGNAVILGDDGEIVRDAAGNVTRVATTGAADATAGADLITSNAGDNVIIAGLGVGADGLGDHISAGGGANNIILGDDGEVNIGGLVRTLNEGQGGDDQITAGGDATGGNVILGGFGADHITLGQGFNTVVGDSGRVERDSAGITAVESVEADPLNAGNDHIVSQGGQNIILGGLGADFIDAAVGSSIVLGDAGRVVVGGDVTTRQETLGGDDIITSGATNTILGGFGADRITLNGGTNTVVGDNGIVRRSGLAVLQVATSETAPGVGGIDTIRMNGGVNIVIGGVGGDLIDGSGGSNIVLGDDGVANFGFGGSWDITTSDPALGDGDTIFGGANNTILGGAGGDTINLGGGVNTVLGDEGVVRRSGPNAITQVATAGTSGAKDTITVTGASSNIILGGVGGDIIAAAAGSSVVLGDNGTANFGFGGSWDIATSDPALGDGDTITGGADNTILGGAGGDTINLGGGVNTVLGDEGVVRRSGPGQITQVATVGTSGAKDTITVTGASSNIILGGAGGDAINAAAGSNVVLGDNGTANFGFGGSWDIDTTDLASGGDDSITGGATNVIAGGFGNDQITLGGGSNTVVGDNAHIARTGGGVVTQVKTTDSAAATGGVDTITSQGGTNVIVGGVGADFILAPLGTNILVGDNAVVNLNNAGSNDVYTIDPTLGGNDQIFGGALDNIILGGAGNDLITGGAGRDIALGDNGIVKRDGSQHVLRVETTDTCIGGDDVILGGGGDNILIGGAGNDTIDGGSGNEVMVGGAGTVDLTGPLPVVTSGDDPCDGADVIHAGDGNDTVWGGGGNDQLYGGLGNDKIYGQGGNDIILGDVGQIIAGRDVLLTDVAHVTAEMALNGLGMPAANAATVNALLNADVVLLAGVNNADGSRKLNSDGTWASRALLLDLAADGDDTISGGDGDDAIFGQRGNDVLTGDAGNDLLSGGAGNDRVDGGTGNDTAVGDDVTIDSPTATFGNVMHGYLVDGVAVVPALQVAPGDTPNAAAAALATLFGNPAMPASSNLPTAGGTLTAYASVLTDFGHHLGQLNGNDTVIGGAGDDTLVGDDQSVVARTLTLDAAAMARTEALTRAMLDITDDFSDLVHAQYSQLGCDWWDDHHDWWDHDDDVVVDNVFTVGADSLDGGDGNDVLIGDDSILAETTFTLQVGYADDFERFAEGMADAGNEAADALLDLVYLDTRLRDQDVLVKHYTHWDHETVHHIDLVAMGNDTLNGGAGNDLMVGDAFTMRTAQANLVLGGTVPNPSDDDIWKNTDWCDDNHYHWWFDDHDHHDWNEDWHFGSVTSSADVINGGTGNDLAWGDSLAVQSSTVTRGAGISNSSYDHAKHDAEDALCSLVSITDSADYWLVLQDGGHCDNDYGDTINGGDGDDILFGQAGDDKLRGEAGADWLIGGAGHNDCLDGGSGSDKTSNGNDNSSTLRSNVNSRLVNWKDSFKNYGVPFSPFGGLKATKYGGCSDRDSFDFLTLDE